MKNVRRKFIFFAAVLASALMLFLFLKGTSRIVPEKEGLKNQVATRASNPVASIKELPRRKETKPFFLGKTSYARIRIEAILSKCEHKLPDKSRLTIANAFLCDAIVLQREWEADRASVVEANTEKLILTIPAYPDVGAEMRNAVYAQLSEIIGSEALKYIDLVELDSLFQDFGKGDQMLILSKREKTAQGQMLQVTWESIIDPAIGVTLLSKDDHATVYRNVLGGNTMTVLPYDFIKVSELEPFLRKHGEKLGL